MSASSGFFVFVLWEPLVNRNIVLGYYGIMVGRLLENPCEPVIRAHHFVCQVLIGVLLRTKYQNVMVCHSLTGLTRVTLRASVMSALT